MPKSLVWLKLAIRKENKKKRIMTCLLGATVLVLQLNTRSNGCKNVKETENSSSCGLLLELLDLQNIQFKLMLCQMQLAFTANVTSVSVDLQLGTQTTKEGYI